MCLTTAGIIGLGQMGILHAAMISSFEGNRVAAISDNDSFLVKLAKKALPNMNHYADYHDMLDKERLDVLYICTPVQTHLPIAHDVLTNFKDVDIFVEKPLAMNYSDASKLVEDSRQSSAITMVGYQKRFEGVFKKAKEVFDAQILGDISFIRAHFLGSNVLSEKQGWKFQSGSGGATLEYGAHLLDLLIWYFGEPISAKSERASLYSLEVEDYISSSVGFVNGITGNLEIGWSMHNYLIPELLIEAHGKNGDISVTEDRVMLHLNREDRDSKLDEGTHMFFGSGLDAAVPFLIANPENVLQEMTFLDCAKNGVQPEQTFRSAAMVNRFVDLLLQGQD